MWEGVVECKECRFWVPYTGEERELPPGRVDIGLCHKFRAPNWLHRMHRDDFCAYGERKKA
jgi:hypothetical protein